MNNRNLLNLRNLFVVIITIALSLPLFNCSESSSTSTEPKPTEFSFSEFFVEKGSDSDTLEIQATSWGVLEYGLFLSHDHSNKAILFEMWNKCGTVLTRTWVKVTHKDLITSAEADTLQQIGFTNFRDTLIVVKTTTN
ncbi:MAG: hypothetical protein KJ799_10405 [Bacteroidetes bacterium]|nr:hypothetical protein [Bacteroidota bacterium]